jgi:hypothetical protein
MEALEAELDPPPLMKTALAHNAKARQGWELMPQFFRRQYLIAIFRSRFPYTRVRYLEKAMLDSVQYADSHWGESP